MTLKVPADVVIHERTLLRQLRELFPNDTIHENARKQSTLKYPATSSFMEFDIWIPTLNVCFEFQDSYHYGTTWYYQKPLTYVQNKDDVKKHIVIQEGFSLVIIPYWWSGDLESLKATIYFQRPDLVNRSNFPPISLNPPPAIAKPLIPGVNELMLASFPNDPNNFHLTLEKNAWWMGEKYDGVRCCWNSKQKQLYTRHGHRLELLQFVPYLPVFVDGELWFGRGQFSLAYSLQLPDRRSWHFLRLIAFDNPSVKLSRKVFEERYSKLISHIPRNDPFTIIAARVSCETSAHMGNWLEKIINDGGEGVILRKKKSLYERGRSLLLVKLKSVQSDKEAVVVAKNLDNSVVLKLPDDSKLTLPHTSLHVTEKLAVGDIVTISYEIHARRTSPVNPSVTRVRTDVSWEDVVASYRTENKYLNYNSHIQGFDSKPINPTSLKQMRAFLQNFAKNRNMDPLLPETWQKISVNLIKTTKGGRKILRKFKGEERHYEMLQTIFPDIGLQHSKFLKRYSHDINNRREYFESYAKRNGFDPKNRENWSVHNKKTILAAQGRVAIVQSTGGYHKALQLAFPEVEFGSVQKNSWKEASARRKFFEEYAKSNQFDPLIAENWYSITQEQIMPLRGASTIVLYHKRSISQALIDLFPSVGFDVERFERQGIWADAANRRKLFESYAEHYGFDPKIPQNWYAQLRSKILAFKGVVSILMYHKTISQALLDLFPEIGLDAAKLRERKFFRRKRKKR